MTLLTDLRFEINDEIKATAKVGELDIEGHLVATDFRWIASGRATDYLPRNNAWSVFKVSGVAEHKTVIQRKLAYSSIQGNYKNGTATAIFDAPPFRGRSVRTALAREGHPPLEHTPEDLVPRFEDYPASESVYYRNAVLTTPHGVDPIANPTAIETPLDLSALDDSTGGFERPVLGTVLTHLQSWRRKKMALGNLLHSLTLAPGEATRVAMQDWTHTVRGTGQEDTTQGDESRATEAQSRSLQEIQDSVARETQHGSSVNAGSSTSAQAGFSLFGFSASAGHSNSVATAASSTDGSRQIGISENQKVQQAAEQHAQASRTRRASVVREVVETDQAQATTRVVANYNHMHALTVQYFEVVEVFDVETRVVSEQPCIYVPFALADGAWLLEKHPSVVADAAEAAGMEKVAAAIRNLANSMPLRPDPAGTAATLDGTKAALAAVGATLDGIKSDATMLQQVGVRAIPRIFPTPPPIPWGDADTAEVRSLAASVLTRTQATLEAIAATNQSVDQLLNAALEEADDEATVRAKLVQRINEHKEYFNQAVWLVTLTPRVVHLALKDRVHAGEVLNDIVDPTPIVITGNLVGFPLASGKWMALDEDIPSVEYGHSSTSEVAVPTGGVFAEAVLGQSVAAERIDLTRFWDWKESPPPLLPTEIAKVDLAHTPTGIDLTSGNLAETAAPLQPVTALPAPAGLAELLNAIGKSDLFRDMGGLDAAKELALESSKHAASGAEAAGKDAIESFKQWSEFAEKVIPMILTDGASTLVGGLANQGDGEGAGGAESLLGGEEPNPESEPGIDPEPTEAEDGGPVT